MENLLEKAKYLLDKPRILPVSEDTLLMCYQCREKSGYGKEIEVRYTSIPRAINPGWSPAWEGRVCVHVQRAQIIEHFGMTALYQAIALRSINGASKL